MTMPRTLMLTAVAVDWRMLSASVAIYFTARLLHEIGGFCHMDDMEWEPDSSLFLKACDFVSFSAMTVAFASVLYPTAKCIALA